MATFSPLSPLSSSSSLEASRKARRIEQKASFSAIAAMGLSAAPHTMTSAETLVIFRKITAKGLKFGFSYDHAQELACNTLLKACQIYDPALNPNFEAFCMGIVPFVSMNLRSIIRKRIKAVVFSNVIEQGTQGGNTKGDVDGQTSITEGVAKHRHFIDPTSVPFEVLDHLECSDKNSGMTGLEKEVCKIAMEALLYPVSSSRSVKICKSWGFVRNYVRSRVPACGLTGKAIKALLVKAML